MVSAISDFEIELHGEARNINPLELRNSLGMLQVDEWADGRSECRRIDGRQVNVRRDGWRVQVWPSSDEAPPVDALPPPADLNTRERLAPRVKPRPGFLEPPPVVLAETWPEPPSVPLTDAWRGFKVACKSLLKSLLDR